MTAFMILIIEPVACRSEVEVSFRIAFATSLVVILSGVYVTFVIWRFYAAYKDLK